VFYIVLYRKSKMFFILGKKAYTLLLTLKNLYQFMQ